MVTYIHINLKTKVTGHIPAYKAKAVSKGVEIVAARCF
jgi:hypothetical protein